ncbi:MAG TPA: hypothetical protein DCQ37_07745 [Desulfobacteraceae bacterium]|nr:hypothetical protein [Desulfobacteraceae bacterium]
MKIRTTLFLLIILCAPIYAGQPIPDDFAYGISLTPETGSAIYAVTLPESIYRRITRADLGDMRVFNRQGEVVPYLLRRPEISSQSVAPVMLPFFPIYADMGKKGGEISFQLSADGRGSILSIQANSGSQPSQNIRAYIIDASAADRAISELEAEWRNEGESFVTTVSVESGNDLTHWQTLVNAATLAKLQYGEHRLDQNRIVLPAKKAKYLRISWSAGRQGVELTKLNALFSPVTAEPDRAEIAVSGAAAKDKPHAYEFDLKGLFPADRINLSLPQRNSLTQAVLKSRATPKEEWKIRHRGLFYNLIVEDNPLNNAPVSLSPAISDRYWRLETDDSGGMGSGMPLLRISWIPHHLVFLARGEAPFQLVYGSTKIKAPEASMDRLFDSIGKNQTHLVRKVLPGNETEIGGADNLKPQAPPFPWKKFMLWAVLIVGVLILAWMAYFLYRQMNAPDKGENSH